MASDNINKVLGSLPEDIEKAGMFLIMNVLTEVGISVSNVSVLTTIFINIKHDVKFKLEISTVHNRPI